MKSDAVSVGILGFVIIRVRNVQKWATKRITVCVRLDLFVVFHIRFSQHYVPPQSSSEYLKDIQ